MKKCSMLLLSVLIALSLSACQTGAAAGAKTAGAKESQTAAQDGSETLLAESQEAVRDEPQTSPGAAVPGIISATAEQKSEDLALFCQTLEKGHKNMYANISKIKFEQERMKIENQLAGMTDSDFYYSLRLLASLIGDSHTSLDFHEAKYQYLHGLPFAIRKYNDGWHLLMLNAPYEPYLGYLLLSINGVSMDETAMRAEAIISSDNPVWRDAQLSNAINFKEALEYLGVVSKDAPIVLTVQNPDDPSDIQTLEIDAMDEGEIMNANILTLSPDQSPETAPNGIYRSLELNPDCYFIQYNSCMEAPDLSMKDFTKTVSEQISAGQYKKVIFDLRYNTGGNSAVFDPLLKELKSLQQKYDLKLYTLIGRSTFSSAIINAIQTEEELNSTLVGSATGGSVNAYGELKSFSLTHMPITVYYSTKYFELKKGYEKDSLYPEMEITQDYKDYISGVDREVETVLALP